MLYTYEIQKTNSYYILTGIFIDKLLLSNLRRETIANLKKDIANKMIDIGFKSVSFLLQNRFLESEIGIEIENKKIKFAKYGIDDIELLILLNVGEVEKLLRKIASGREISRTMIALKSVISFVNKIYHHDV